MSVFTILRKLIPAVRKLVKALGKDSPGGKKVTPKEADGIAAEFTRDVMQIIKDL